MNLFSPDVSNWDSPNIENNAGCLAQSATGPVVVRASTEDQRLRDITIAQIDSLEGAGRSTMAYDWAYGQQVPEANAQATVSLIDGHVSVKRIWADVEDYGSFIRHFPNERVPHRLLATLDANDFMLGLSETLVDKNGLWVPALSSGAVRNNFVQQANAFTLAAISPAEAVAWLRAWATEIRKLGYTPGFYSAPGVWNDLCGGNTSFEDVDGWGAAWVNTPITTPPVYWGGIRNWAGVQYMAGGSEATICNLSLDMNAWNSDRLGLAPVQPPVPPVENPPSDGGPYATQADLLQLRNDFTRLNSTLVWRLENIEKGFASVGKYLDPTNTPTEEKS